MAEMKGRDIQFQYHDQVSFLTGGTDVARRLKALLLSSAILVTCNRSLELEIRFP